MSGEIYDLAIIGGGPAGITAAVYSARKKIKSVIVTDSWGGQSMVSSDMQNWIGIPSIPGTELAKKLEEHVRKYADDSLDIEVPALAEKIEKTDKGFRVVLNNGKEIDTKLLFLGLGATRRKLRAKGAEEFDHKGLTYCATCDGPMFSGRDVVVIGGGNAGFETAAQLLAYTKSVTLLEYGEEFLADEVTVEKLKKNENFKAITNVETLEIKGEQFVSSIVFKDRTTGEETELQTGGIFIEIGMIPNTEIVKDIVELNERGQIIVDPRTQRTNTDGVWAAGDCTNVLYHQNGIAIGDATKAIEDLSANL